jgi:protein-S-isoprenylcysteine O-methyltransferase Ste14
MRGSWSNVARRIRVPLGFLFAAFFLWRARPTAGSLAHSLLLVVPGLLLRAYASGYVKKNATLTVTGPYAYTRNPLYLGSTMLAFGFAIASRSLWVTALLTVFFVIIYVPTILSEEEFLRSKFPEFDAYAKRVPRFFPRLTPAALGDSRFGGFSGTLYLKHREYNASLGACAIYAALLASHLLRH